MYQAINKHLLASATWTRKLEYRKDDVWFASEGRQMAGRALVGPSGLLLLFAYAWVGL